MDSLNNRNFKDALPSEKAHRIIEGIDFLIADMNRHVANVKVLNGWIKMMPELIANNNARFDDGDENLLNRAAGDYSSSALQISRHITEFAINYDELNRAIEHFKNINPNNDVD